jgi:hypothetical protein
MRCLRPILLAAIAALAGHSARAATADTAGNRGAVASAQRQLRSSDPSQRAAALVRLREAPSASAAKVVMTVGLADSAPEVRRASYETLLAWKDRKEICTCLSKTLDKETRGKKPGPLVAPVLAVLLASELPEGQREATRFIDGSVPEGIATVAAIADELGRRGDEQSLDALRNMTRLKCFASTFACRRAVVQAMVLVRSREAVDTLVALLAKVDGEVHGDIVRHLADISGQQCKTDQAWREWWKGHKDTFEFPIGAASRQDSPSLASVYYYGLPIYAQRMVFVIDISGSMGGARLETAKRELLSAIASLPRDHAFAIVVFSDKTAVWKPGLTLATAEAKETVRRYVAGLRAGGRTATFDALEAAFRFDAEAIYLLTDGEPNHGKIHAPLAIIAAIGRVNHARRLSIYTIGIMPGVPGGPLDSFVKTLAEQNWGLYRRVDQ